MTKLTEELLNDPIIKARIAQLNDQRVRWSLSHHVMIGGVWRAVSIDNYENRSRECQMTAFRQMVPHGCLVWQDDESGYVVKLTDRVRVVVRFLDKHPVSV